jgi:fructose-1,6-bisphosphatase/inositol monophosphatase family enzyme
MKTEINEILLQLAAKAGEIAVAGQERAKAQVKPDLSYVTDIDLELSELSIQMLSAVIPEDHIITEEHLEHLEAVQSGPAGSGDELLAIIDPLDGTRNYFHNMPLYGVSVGILKNRKPWLGFVMFPALGEMFHCDGQSAYFTRNVFGPEPDRTALKQTSPDLNGNSTVLCSEPFASRYRWNYDSFKLIVSECATLNLCWPAMGRGIGCMFGEHIWDLAGSWPTLAMLGFTLRGIHTGRQIERFDPDDYDSDTLLMKEPVVISRPEHFQRLAAAASPLD